MIIRIPGWTCRWRCCFTIFIFTSISPAFATWPSARRRWSAFPCRKILTNPFAARNVKDFWNRWHITLSTWMRDVVFSPLSKYFVGKFGIRLADHAIALTIFIVFLLVGIWHGAGWNFCVYGLIHAIGVVANHYYTIFLKRGLGRERFKAYNENRWIHAAAVVLAFCYCGGSLIFFANTFPQVKEMLSILQ